MVWAESPQKLLFAAPGPLDSGGYVSKKPRPAGQDPLRGAQLKPRPAGQDPLRGGQYWRRGIFQGHYAHGPHGLGVRYSGHQITCYLYVGWHAAEKGTPPWKINGIGFPLLGWGVVLCGDLLNQGKGFFWGSFWGKRRFRMKLQMYNQVEGGAQPCAPSPQGLVHVSLTGFVIERVQGAKPSSLG